MSALRLFDKFQKLLDVTWGSIADGQTLKRSGSNIIGYTPGGGSGDVVGPASSVDSEVSLFSGTGGKTIKRATGTGIALVSSGVWQTPQATLPYVNCPVGSVLQVINATPDTAYRGTAAPIPYDDTRPQWSEGDSLISLSITPKIATSKIYLCCSGQVSMGAGGIAAIFTMFRGTGPDAISSRPIMPASANYPNAFVVDCFDAPGAGTFTYTVKWGTSDGINAAVINGTVIRLFGGSSQVNFYAQEIKA